MPTPDQPENDEGAPRYQAPPEYWAPPQYAPPPQYGTAPPQYGAVPPQYGSAPPQYGMVPPQYGVPGAYQGLPGPGEPFDGAASPQDLTRPLYSATFAQAVKRYFQNYATFSGRASRSEYWWIELFFLVAILPAFVLMIIGAVFLAAGSASDMSSGPAYSSSASAGLGGILLVLGYVYLIVLMLGTIIPSLAIAWRRLHDAGMAGPMYFLSCIPYAGGIIMIIFMCLGSKPQGRVYDRRM